MDAVPLSFLLETLAKEAIALGKKLRGVSEEIGLLSRDLEFFKAKLEKWSKGPITDEELKVLVKQFREAVYKAEDILDDYFVEKANYESKNWIRRKLINPLGYAQKLLDVARSIRSMRTEVDRILGSLNTLPEESPDEEETATRAQILQVEKNYVVGFKKEQDKIINDLTGGCDELEVISIFGMLGVGKTTLVDTICNSPRIVGRFKKHIWVTVTQNFGVKEVFLKILRQLTEVDDKICDTDVRYLVEKLHGFFEKDNYLIVMDDVWTIRDWDSLKNAFPNSNKRSRILLTTRHLDVAKHANRNRLPIDLKVLSDDESWELLKTKALRSVECSDELEKHGRHIASQCGGLPLAIVVMGGILLERGTDSSAWEEISNGVSRYIVPSIPGENRVIDLSFYQLLYPLKACFLYFGMFPKGCKIPVKKLISLWIAEGFVQKEKNKSLENTATEYINDLVNKSLVMVAKWSPIRKVKTCYVHDVMHEFCRRKAAEEYLYHVVENNNTSDSTADLDYVHRIAIHSAILAYISSENVGTHARSFLFSSPGDITLKATHTIYPLKNYKSLRVLDGKPIIFHCFPDDLAQLVHLRFLVLQMKDKILPECISNLWNLQTLIVHSPWEDTLEIKGDAKKMTRLRHLKTNASTSWEALSKRRKKKEVSVTHTQLTTLSMITPETCTKDAFERVPNLNKLGIRGQLAELFKVISGGDSLFHNVIRLNFLENLKLINNILDPSDSRSQIIDFPEVFPQNLKKLTLIGIQLDEKIMSTLGMLESLEILKMKRIKFKEMKWVMTRNFPKLKVLHIESAELRFWEASAGHFPNLRHICLVDCTDLRQIPVSFASILSLESMELERTAKLAANCAKEIEEQKMLHHQTNWGNPFKLSISTPA